MYNSSSTANSLSNAIMLAAAGSGIAVFGIGLIECIVFAVNRNDGIGWLLAAVAIPAAIQFVITAGGKPGEYGRFALLPDTVLAIVAVAGLSLFRSWLLLALPLLFITCSAGMAYVIGFRLNSLAHEMNDTRSVAARILETTRQSWAPARPTLGVFADPAPYCLPPVDLDGWNIVRLPRKFDAAQADKIVNFYVWPDDQQSPNLQAPTPISWAEKHFTIIGNGTKPPDRDNRPQRS